MRILSTDMDILKWIKKVFGVKQEEPLPPSNRPTPSDIDYELYKGTVAASQEIMKKELAKMQVNFGDKDKYTTGNPDFTPAQIEIIPQEQVKEIAMFARANNVIAEYYGEAPPISDSNLSAWEQDQPNYDPFKGMIVVKYKGFVIIDYDEEGIKLKIEQCIDKGITNGFYTEEEFNRRFYSKSKIPTYNEIPEDQWAGEDTDKLTQVQESEKERLLKMAQTDTHILSGFPINNSNIKPHDEQRPDTPDLLDD